jgi:hypothetical protein
MSAQPIIVLPAIDADKGLLELANKERGQPLWFTLIPEEMLDSQRNYWAPWIALTDSRCLPDIVDVNPEGLLFIGYM